MWHAFRTELSYSRPWMLGGLGIATFVAVLLSVLVRLFEDGEGPPSFVVTIFPIIAGMVVAFIVQGYRVEERRARLLLAGPLTPRQLAWMTVMLPACFAGIGAIAIVPTIWLATLITGKFEPSSLPFITGFACQFWAYAQLGPLAQESTAARRQHRTAAFFIGWGVFVGAILVLVASQVFMHSIYGFFGVASAAVTTMVVAAVLYQRRTDFTR